MEITKGQIIRLACPSDLNLSSVPTIFSGEEAVVVSKNVTGHYSIEILSNKGYYYDITDDQILTTEVL